MPEAAQAAEAPAENPYVGSEGFDDLDTLSPEEQAIYDAEMAGEDLPEPPNEEPAPVEAAEPQPDDPPPGAEAAGEPEVTAEDLEKVPHGTEAASSEVEETEEQPTPEPPADHMIPKARLDRELAKRRELEQRLQELESSRKVEEVAAEDKPIDLSEVIDREAITKALDINLDGKNTEAAEILIGEMSKAVAAGVSQGRAQMREELSATSEAAIAKAVGTVTQRSVEDEYNAAVDQIEAAYPVFNPESDQFSDELSSKAVAYMKAFREDGDSPAEAMRNAAELALSRYAPELLKKTGAPEVTPNQPGENERRRNADAAAAQPTRTAGRPAREEPATIDIEKLTEDEFDALPESTKAELRGDMF